MTRVMGTRAAVAVVAALAGFSLGIPDTSAKGVCTQPVPRVAIHLLKADRAHPSGGPMSIDTINYLTRNYCLDLDATPPAESTENIGEGCSMSSGKLNGEWVYWANCPSGAIAALVTPPPASPGPIAAPSIPSTPPPPPTGGPMQAPPMQTLVGRWFHNGSEMQLDADIPSKKRTFYYKEPRPGLIPVGVRRGTLLFEGQRIGDRYEGKAFIFSRSCGPLPYHVSGDVSLDQKEVTMHGNAPRVDADCRVVGYQSDELKFIYQESLE